MPNPSRARIAGYKFPTLAMKASKGPKASARSSKQRGPFQFLEESARSYPAWRPAGAGAAERSPVWSETGASSRERIQTP
mmetsp:Transcript_27347/g.106993  ORF Transcript_27347/g.106993 Transcript_27347/m.106993 type:complete len:80 (-) Transcript_27347:223-462(-)